MSDNHRHASQLRIARRTAQRLGQVVMTTLLATGLPSQCRAEDAMYRIGVNANFDAGEMRVTSVDDAGPATRMRNSDGQVAGMDRGDTIVLIDSRPVGSHADFIAAVNQSLDGELTALVRDVNTGGQVEWIIDAEPTARTAYEATRDAYNRALRNDAILHNKFVFDVRQAFVMTTLTSTLRPLYPPWDTLTPDEMLKQTIVGTQVIRLHEASAAPLNVFTDADFGDVDAALAQTFDQLSRSANADERRKLAIDASDSTRERLQMALVRWAEANNKRLVEEATVPVLIRFRVRTSTPGARVQLLSVGDKIAILTSLGETPRAPTARGIDALDNCSLWNTLPDEEGAAYGRYHYRLIDQTGNVVKSPDYSSRAIMRIVEEPTGGEILF